MTTITGWCSFAQPITIPAGNYAEGHAQTLAVCLHIVNGTFQSCISHFKDPKSGVSANFCIGPAGELVQFVSIHDTAYAQGLSYDQAAKVWYTNRAGEGRRNVKPTWPLLTPGMSINTHVISIEHAGKSGDPLSAAMQATQQRLLHWIAEQTNLVYRAGTTLIGHSMLDTVGRTFCPGPAFDLAAIAAAANVPAEPDWRELWGGRFPYVPQFGIETAWREAYRQGTKLGQAVSDELAIVGGVVRCFERGYITYSAARGVKVGLWP